MQFGKITKEMDDYTYHDQNTTNPAEGIELHFQRYHIILFNCTFFKKQLQNIQKPGKYSLFKETNKLIKRIVRDRC